MNAQRREKMGSKVSGFLDCTVFSNCAAWHANNCQVCTKAGTTDCPHIGKSFKKKEPLFCKNLERK